MVIRDEIARGDVWWVDFGDDTGDRPAVVLTRASLAGRIDGRLVVPCTRTVRNVPSEVALAIADGMPRPSVANTASTTIAYTAQFRRRIGGLPAEKINAICAALAWFTGCD